MRRGSKILPPNLLAPFLKLPSERGKGDGEEQLLFIVVTDTKAESASVSVKGEARLQRGRDGAKQVFGSHLLQQDFLSPVERAEGAVGGWCWQPVPQKTSPSKSQLFQARVLSPSTARLSKIRQGGSILWETGASTAGIGRTIIHRSSPATIHRGSLCPQSQQKPQGRDGKKSCGAECLHTLRRGGESLHTERVGGSLY